MIHVINGNLLNTDAKYICHQVNCQGVMGSGVAKSIRDKWPVVYEAYREWYKDSTWRNKTMLGCCFAVDINGFQWVVNMAAQENYGYDGNRYTSYDAFYNCLYGITYIAQHGDSIAFPFRIGSDRGGANWNIIRTMIEEVLGKDYEVYIYKYEGK